MSQCSSREPKQRKRILFFAEAVTLAHVARPHVLAQALPTASFEVLFASDPRFDRLFANLNYKRRQIHSISSQRFLGALASGSPAYDLASLKAYVEEDLAVIDEFRPEAIVGDFRLSLSVSARLRKIPYFGITNAYWSPHARLHIPVPELSLTRWLGYRWGQVVFDIARPIAFAMHARPMNRFRQAHGLPSLGRDVRRVYTDADTLLFSDISGLVKLRESPEQHRFIGPINWSPDMALPDWWTRVPSDRPVVYLTLGSSGDERLIPTLIHSLAQLPVSLLVSTAGRPLFGRALSEATYPNVFAADYLHGEDAATRADLVICNGGSPTTYQALAAGKPVLGIPANLDQCLNMAAIQTAGVGRILRVANLKSPLIQQAVQSTLAEVSSTKLKELATAIHATDPARELQLLLQS